jgi:hypothetical protein
MVIVAVLIALVWLALRLTGGDDASEGVSAPAATAPAPVVPANGTFEVALSAADRACDPQAVRVTPTVPTGQRAGASVAINLVLSTTEKAPCTLTPSDADMIAVISAGGDTVWDSTRCTTALMREPAQLAGGGWATVVPTSWSGRSSGRSCDGTESRAGAGRYTVQIGTLGGEPGEFTFDLGAKPKSKAKPKASPSPTASASAPKKS